MAAIAVIGGGAAGMMAAITAAECGAAVTVFEHQDRVGRKILMTGNGRCNLSNLSYSGWEYYGEEPEFAKGVLSQFTANDTVSFFKRLGLLVKDKNGYLYPVSEQASAVLDVLRNELVKKKVKVKTNVSVQISFQEKEQKFLLRYENGEGYYDMVILACGSRANPRTGSDGSGYGLAEAFGHKIIKPLPALVQLRCRENFFKGIAGVRCEAGLRLLTEKGLQAEERGELQLTDYGISGIPVFQFSRVAARALDAGEKVSVEIDFLPSLTTEVLGSFLREVLQREGNRECPVEEVLAGVIHKKLLMLILKENGIKGSRGSGSITAKETEAVLRTIKCFTVQVGATNPFDNAQVCCGGVDCSEIDGNCQSKKVPGLFFAGEIMDVDGICGGYNLQWAWSSGYVAGKSAASGREAEKPQKCRERKR